MSNETTLRMLQVYEQLATPTLFLSSFFLTTPRSFYNSEEVEIDIVRGNEDVSIVIQDLSVGGRMNSADLYTNKRFKPPIHDEIGPINVWDLLKRVPGADPFADVDFQANATLKALMLITQLADKIKRSIELQASQILQTGKLDLKDKNGVTLYTLDFKPKTTHFSTVGTTWENASANPIQDLENLGKIIRGDCFQRPDTLIMGIDAFNAFVDNAFVKARYDNRRYELGTITALPPTSDAGNYRGQVTVGNYTYDIWCYDGQYKDPQTGSKIPYVDDKKVIMRASRGRLDKTFGGIPRFGNPAANVLPILPPRLPSQNGGMDIFTNAWITENQRQFFVSASSRPLLIPTAIDSFGALTVLP